MSKTKLQLIEEILVLKTKIKDLDSQLVLKTDENGVLTLLISTLNVQIGKHTTEGIPLWKRIRNKAEGRDEYAKEE